MTDREKFEQWAKEALEAHYDEHESIVTYDSTSAWIAWQASRRTAMEEAAAHCDEYANRLRGSAGCASGFVALTLAANALRSLANKDAARTGDSDK
jgi:hypothetical protein